MENQQQQKEKHCAVPVRFMAQLEQYLRTKPMNEVESIVAAMRVYAQDIVLDDSDIPPQVADNLSKISKIDEKKSKSEGNKTNGQNRLAGKTD